MGERKVTKIASIVTAIMVILFSLFLSHDWNKVGIFASCGLWGRLLYSFCHANIVHAALNAWCLLSLVFIYDITMWRLSLAYIIAATVPANTLYSLFGIMDTPTVGLSAVVFVLFGSISFEVMRKWYYQAWMLFYLVMGFLSPNTNAYLHLYCYVAGLTIALLNKPVKCKHYGN